MLSLSLPLLAALAANSDAPIRLAALLATSGAHPENVLDGDKATVWRAEGDPTNEGVLFRFEQDTSLAALKIAGCDAQPLKVFGNGSPVPGGALVKAAEGQVVDFYGFTYRSVFLQGGCVADVQFLGKGKVPLEVLPPRAVSGTVATTSTLAPAEAYHPRFLFDGRLDFGWAAGDHKNGVGQAVTMTFASPQALTGVEIWNGYQRSPVHFSKNARASVIRFDWDGGGTARFTLKKDMGREKLDLPPGIKTTKLTLTIEKSTHGSKYPDLVISELRFWDAGGPFTLSTNDAAESKAALQKAIAKSNLAQVVDASFEGAGCGEHKSEVKFRSSHDFVAYVFEDKTEGDAAYAGASQEDVSEGTWVVGQLGGPWSKIDLFGRRHRVSREWAEYGGNTKKDEDRIIGGTLRVARVADLGATGLVDLLKTWADGPNRSSVACLTLTDADDVKKLYDDLVAGDAVVVEGDAMTELLKHPAKGSSGSVVPKQ